MPIQSLDVIPIRALRDNYIWALINRATAEAFVVDPGDAKPVIEMLQHSALTLKGILLTHHHADHSGGIRELLDTFSTLAVIGSHRSYITDINYPVNDGDIINVLGTSFTAMEIPGHTLDHTAYYQDDHRIFTGDTLFSAGCGRIFEGTPMMMYQSLQRIAALPETTLLYCGHEYTLANLEFAQVVEPDNASIKLKRDNIRQLGAEACTLPSTLAEEKLCNPFLRCHVEAVIRAAENHAGHPLNSPLDVFTVLREWKNHF